MGLAWGPSLRENLNNLTGYSLEYGGFNWLRLLLVFLFVPSLAWTKEAPKYQRCNQVDQRKCPKEGSDSPVCQPARLFLSVLAWHAKFNQLSIFPAK